MREGFCHFSSSRSFYEASLGKRRFSEADHANETICSAENAATIDCINCNHRCISLSVVKIESGRSRNVKH